VAFWRNSTYSEIFFAWKPMVLLWLSSNQNDVSSLEWLIVALIPFYCSYSVLKHCALRLLVRYRSLFGCPAVLVSCLHSMFAMLTISCKHYCLYCSLAHIFVALILFARSILSCPWPVLDLSSSCLVWRLDWYIVTCVDLKVLNMPDIWGAKLLVGWKNIPL
jgi:hypothetical protein